MSKQTNKAVTDAVNGSPKTTPPADPPPPMNGLPPGVIAVAPDDPRIPRECVLRVSGQDLQAILAGIDELPGRISRHVHARITAQVNEQIRAALEPPAAPPIPPPPAVPAKQ